MGYCRGFDLLNAVFMFKWNVICGTILFFFMCLEQGTVMNFCIFLLWVNLSDIDCFGI